MTKLPIIAPTIHMMDTIMISNAIFLYPGVLKIRRYRASRDILMKKEVAR